MGAWGALIMSFFAAVFAALTLYWQWHVIGPGLAAPFVPTVLIMLLAVQTIRRPGEGAAPSRRGARAIMWSSIAEGVGLFIGANVVINLHRPDLLLPTMALVVGLHFLPIAWGASFRPFYTLGMVLIVAAVVGILAPPPIGGVISGLSAALALWTASGLAFARDRRAKLVAALKTS